jgi:hypothetical protein
MVTPHNPVLAVSLAPSGTHGRSLLRTVLAGPIRFTPIPERHAYRFDGSAAVGPLLTGKIGDSRLMVPVRSFAKGWCLEFRGIAA